MGIRLGFRQEEGGPVLEELQLIADSLAARLERSVAIDDPRMRLLVHTPHRGEAVDRHRVVSIMQKAATPEAIDWAQQHGIATATGPVRIPPDEQNEVAARVCVPVRHESYLYAYLWLLDPHESATDADLEQAQIAAEEAGKVLYTDRLLGDLRRGRERELLRDLVGSDAAARAQAVRQLVSTDRLPEGAEVVVLVAEVTGQQADADLALGLALQRAAGRLAPLHTIWTTRGGVHGVLLVGGREAPAPARLRTAAEELYDELGSARVGIGPAGPLESAYESHGCALQALQIAGHVPALDPVAAWDELGVYRLLAQLPLDRLRADTVPDGLRQLAEADDSGVLMETLEVYLDEAGRTPAAIERLQIHRTSLYYRLNRIEQLTGMSLGDGTDRLALHLGLKLLRLI